MRTATALMLVTLLAGCADKAEPESTANPRTAMDALIAFARKPSDSTSAAVPFADRVALGLGDTLRVRRAAEALRKPAAWWLDIDLFRGRAGTASALELIASETGRLSITEGPHPHCASGPVPPPRQAAALHRVVVQPRDADGCLDWWTVDAFVNDEGEIEAVTLDLWEP